MATHNSFSPVGAVVLSQQVGAYPASTFLSEDEYIKICNHSPVSIEQSPTYYATDALVGAWETISENKIYVSLKEIDAGLIGEDMLFEFSIWNAHSSGVFLSSVSVISGTGTSSTLPTSAFFFTPETSKMFSISVLKDGPPEQKTTYTLTFSNGDVFEIKISGRRLDVFPYELDAAGGCEVTFSSLSAVERSFFGREQKRSIKDILSVKMKAKYWFKDLRGVRCMNFIRSAYNRILAVPFYPENMEIEADPEGTNEIYIKDNSNRWFLENKAQFAILWQEEDDTNYELVKILSLTSGKITTENNIIKSFLPSKTILSPALISVSPKLSYAQKTQTIPEFTLEFVEL